MRREVRKLTSIVLAAVLFFDSPVAASASEARDDAALPIQEISAREMSRLMHTAHQDQARFYASDGKKKDHKEEQEETEESGSRTHVDVSTGIHPAAKFTPPRIVVPSKDLGRAALIVFAVIGVVVVVGVIFYSGIYLYDIVRGNVSLNPWFQAEGEYSILLPTYFSEKNSSSRMRRLGYIGGFKFNSGLNREKTFDLGLTFEGGRHHLIEKNLASQANEFYDGAYGLMGPAILFSFGGLPHRPLVRATVLTGTSSDSHVGLISKAQIGLQYPIYSSIHGALYAGIDAGALFFNVVKKDRLVRNVDEFSFISSLSVGYEIH